jgi:hypothetical protein
MWMRPIKTGLRARGKPGMTKESTNQSIGIDIVFRFIPPPEIVKKRCTIVLFDFGNDAT